MSEILLALLLFIGTALSVKPLAAEEAIVPVQNPGSLKIDSVKRLAEYFDRQAQNGNLRAARDACSAWKSLMDLHTEVENGALAAAAYAQLMRRVRQLRAADPRVLGEWAFNFRSDGQPPVDQLLEALVHARSTSSYYLPNEADDKLWDAVLRAPLAIPEGAAQSLPVFEFTVPIIDQVYLPTTQTSR